LHLYQIKNLSFSYHHGRGQSLNPIVAQQVLNDISVDIGKAELTCIAGPSGSGKSTLLNILGFIDPVQTGQIFYGDQNINNLNSKMIDRIRLFEIGFVFQDFQLFDVLSVCENVEYFAARQGLPAGERRNRVDEALSLVGMQDYYRRLPRELSGGQKQRVAVARALAKKPKVIIADEPTANLDSKNARSMIELFQKLVSHHEQTIILASHDPVGQGAADRLMVLQDGNIQQDVRRRAFSNAV